MLAPVSVLMLVKGIGAEGDESIYYTKSQSRSTTPKKKSKKLNIVYVGHDEKIG